MTIRYWLQSKSIKIRVVRSGNIFFRFIGLHLKVSNHEKVYAVLKMQKPKNVKELLSFLGVVIFYFNMCHKKYHLLTPMTDFIGYESFV